MGGFLGTMSCDKLGNRPCLVEFQSGHIQIEIVVMLDGISVSIEQSSVPVADGLVSCGGMAGKTIVATRQIEFAVVARKDHKR